MHAVVRQYTGASALVEEMARNKDDIKQLLTSVPGFVEYHALRSGDGLTTVTVCNDETCTKESTRRAAEWVKEHLPAGGLSAPMIMEGDDFIHFGG